MRSPPLLHSFSLAYLGRNPENFIQSQCTPVADLFLFPQIRRHPPVEDGWETSMQSVELRTAVWP